jgi:hypothetical protein
MIKIRLLKNVTRMSDLKSTNPKDRKILSKKISGLKSSLIDGTRIEFSINHEFGNKMIDSQEISEVDISKRFI